MGWRKNQMEMRKYFAQNQNEKQCTKVYEMQIKQCLEENL